MSLAPDEHRAVRLAGELSTLITESIIGYGPARDEDIATLEFYVHGIQRMVLAQAAAREYLLQYRLLGEVLPEREVHAGKLSRLSVLAAGNTLAHGGC